MISVIVCTYNRAQSLRYTLASIDHLTIPNDVEVELLVVDNNSSDETRSVVEQFAQTAKITTRYVFEKTQGLSSARNAGLREAKGEIFAFTDDDCFVDSSWLMTLANEFATNPTLSLVGGRIELYNPEDLPITIRTSRERVAFSRPSTPFFFIFGCNMSFTRSVVTAVGEFDSHLDSSSGTGLIADDMDFIYRAYKRGFSMLYSPDVLVWHNHGRKTEEQGEKVKRGYLRGRGAFYCKHIVQRDSYALKMLYWEVRALLKELWRNFQAGKTVATYFRILLLMCSGMLRWLTLALRPTVK